MGKFNLFKTTLKGTTWAEKRTEIPFRPDSEEVENQVINLYPTGDLPVL